MAFLSFFYKDQYPKLFSFCEVGCDFLSPDSLLYGAPPQNGGGGILSDSGSFSLAPPASAVSMKPFSPAAAPNAAAAAAAAAAEGNLDMFAAETSVPILTVDEEYLQVFFLNIQDLTVSVACQAAVLHGYLSWKMAIVDPFYVLLFSDRIYVTRFCFIAVHYQHLFLHATYRLCTHQITTLTASSSQA